MDRRSFVISLAAAAVAPVVGPPAPSASAAEAAAAAWTVDVPLRLPAGVYIARWRSKISEGWINYQERFEIPEELSGEAGEFRIEQTHESVEIDSINIYPMDADDVYENCGVQRAWLSI